MGLSIAVYSREDLAEMLLRRFNMNACMECQNKLLANMVNKNYENLVSLPDVNTNNEAIPVLIVVAVIYCIRKERKAQREFEELCRDNPYYFEQLTEQYIFMDYHPLLIAIISGKGVSVWNCFRIMLLELCRKKIVYVSTHEILVKKQRSGIKYYEEKFIQMLERNFPYEDYGDLYGYDLAAVQKLLEGKISGKKIYEEMSTIYREFKDAYMEFWRHKRHKCKLKSILTKKVFSRYGGICGDL